MDSIIIVWLLLIVYLIAESGLRKGENARNFEAGESDQKTSSRLGLTYGVIIIAILLSPLLNNAQIGQLVGVPIVKWFGIGIMLAGLVIRAWAMRALGQFYTRTLRTTADQQLIQEGIYHVIRHPGYLGSLLFWIGGGIATGNWILMAGITLALVLVYRARIQAEETMLLTTFGQAYRDYSQQTWRLIPFLF